MHTNEDNLYNRMNTILLERMATKDKQIERMRSEITFLNKEVDKMQLVLVIAYLSSAFSIIIVIERIFGHFLRSL